MTYIVLSKSDDSVVVANGSEALTISLTNKETIKKALKYGNSAIPEEDSEFWSGKKGETYEQKALSNIKINRMPHDGKLSYSASDTTYESVNAVIESLVKEFRVSPIQASFNFTERETKNGFLLKRMETGLQRDFIKNAPERIKKLEADFANLDNEARKHDWTYSKLAGRRNELTKEINTLKTRFKDMSGASTSK